MAVPELVTAALLAAAAGGIFLLLLQGQWTRISRSSRRSATEDPRLAEALNQSTVAGAEPLTGRKRRARKVCMRWERYWLLSGSLWDAVNAMLKVVNPSPAVQDEIVHSEYLYKSADDVLELGWDWVNGSAAVVFSTKTYNGHYSYVANLSNPGGGFLSAGATPTFRIWRNVSGSSPDRFDMYRDGLWYGY